MILVGTVNFSVTPGPLLLSVTKSPTFMFICSVSNTKVLTSEEPEFITTDVLTIGSKG